MTYYRGNIYTDPATAGFAHDDCLPDDQFTTTMLADFSTGRIDPVTGYTVYDKVPFVHQNWPWHWNRIYGAPEPCDYCGQPVS
jgi:hypothetical protein